MPHLVCTSFTTPSPRTAFHAFAAAVEQNSTVGVILAERGVDVPNDHDLLFAAPENGGGVFADIDAEAMRRDGGEYMAALSVTRDEIEQHPGLLAAFYGGSRAGTVRLLCTADMCGNTVYRVEARSHERSYDGTFTPFQIRAWADAACRRIDAANAVINAVREPSRAQTWADEEEAAV